MFLAKQGYVTVTFDVRGTGAACEQEPRKPWIRVSSAGPNSSISPRSWADRHDVRQDRYRYRRRESTGDHRLQLRRRSQSWKAAAWSGRTPPTTNNRGIKTFPKYSRRPARSMLSLFARRTVDHRRNALYRECESFPILKYPTSRTCSNPGSWRSVTESLQLVRRCRIRRRSGPTILGGRISPT